MTHHGERLVTLPDGREVSNYSEEYRHHCECQFLLDMPSRAHRLRYLYGHEEKWSNGQKRVIVKGVKHTRGEAAARHLQEDATKLHALLRAPK